MVLYERFSFRDADKILERKGLLQEVKDVMLSVIFVKHGAIQALFEKKGWGLEHYIFKEVRWAWDAFKDNVAVSIELSLCDSVHRDFLRAIQAYKQGRLEVLVYVTSTAKEPKYVNVLRDIEIFSEILDFPILLIGLEP